ncbi:phage scaffolding protein [Leuconostoc carnosum]|uniref:phage scaffolding protein n=1 Tax=Leuconostoc TaxID=1243 RepID=UPI001680CC9F|nr:phage scaffolding protein [Leuconostoc carnosum]
MKREQLVQLGLSDDQVNGVMKIHGQDTEAHKDAAALQDQVTELTTERDGFKAQIKERDKDLAELKKVAGDNEDYKSKYDELKDKYSDDTKNLQANIDGLKLDTAIVQALSGSKARNSDDLMRFIDKNELKLNDKGEVEGLATKIETIQKDKPYLFDLGKTDGGYKPASGDPAAQDATDAFISAMGGNDNTK